MLTKNEPYRYATPRSTADKVASLRIAATGERRRAGTPKGVKAMAKSPSGPTRAVKALATVYRDEGLPARSEPTAAEIRMLEGAGLATFVDSLQSEHRIPRRLNSRSKGKTAS
jgi:hypothetical protein